MTAQALDDGAVDAIVTVAALLIVPDPTLYFDPPLDDHDPLFAEVAKFVNDMSPGNESLLKKIPVATDPAGADAEHDKAVPELSDDVEYAVALLRLTTL